MGALSDLLVVELGDGIASGYAGRLFAGFGATVVTVEPPGGSRLRRMRAVPGGPLPHEDEAPWWLYLGMGKRSLEAGLAEPAIRELCRGAGVVIADQPASELAAHGLDYDALVGANPRLVYLSLRPYGDWGPDAAHPAENINAFGAAAQMWLTGEPGREPLCTAGEQAWMQLGQSGFSAAQFALLGALRTGLGQRVEVSAQEVVGGATEGFGPNARFLGAAQGRSGRARFAMFGVYPCRDGYAGVYGTNRQLKAFSELAGRPDLAADPRFTNLAGMIRANAELEPVVLDYFAAETRASVRANAKRTGMTMAPVETLDDVLASEHLAARGFFSTCETATGKRVTLPGRPFIMSATPWESRPAPLRGELSAASAIALARRPVVAPAQVNPRDRLGPGLLAGARILDFTAYWAGPYATKWLADFGADVVKVESPAMIDFIRSTTVKPDHERPYDYSAYFNNYNRGKRSLGIDPAHPDGRQVLLDILPHFDAVVENFRAGRMEEIGLGYEVLRRVKPGIVMVSVSGYGQFGPDAALAGVGTNMEQLSGLAWLNQYSDSDQPYNTGIAYGDPTSGTAGAAAVAMALRHRDRTGEGQYVEISGHETIAGMIGEQFAARSLGLPVGPKGNRHPDMAPHGCFPCEGDDAWITVACNSDACWIALCHVIERPELVHVYPSAAARLANEDEVEAAVMGWTVLHGAREAVAALRAAGIPAAPVLSTLDLPMDPHMRARGYYVSLAHPDQGAWPHDGVAWRMSRTPAALRRSAPRFSADTRGTLLECGISAERIDALYASGAAADRPGRW